MTILCTSLVRTNPNRVPIRLSFRVPRAGRCESAGSQER